MIYTVLRYGQVTPVHVDVRGPHPILFVGMSGFQLDSNLRGVKEWKALCEIPGQPFVGLPLYYDPISANPNPEAPR